MNKRQLKKLSRKRQVTKEDAQIAFNVVARYLNSCNTISFQLSPWSRHNGENKWTITKINTQKEFDKGFYEDILIASEFRR